MALIGLMRSLALEFAKTNLTVNAVCPAFVDTPMVDDSAERIQRATGRSEEEARGALAAMNANGRLIHPRRKSRRHRSSPLPPRQPRRSPAPA